MSVYDHQASLLLDINKTLSVLDRVKSLSNKLSDDTSLGECAYILSQFPDLCEEANQYLKSSQQHCEIIRSILGNNIFLASLLPTVKSIAFISADASILYNSEQHLSDLTHNPVSDYYKKPPERQVFGDLGELEVFSMLVDPNGEDKLSEQEAEDIQIKPHLPSNINDNDKEPDFHIPSRNLIIDSKAWKRLNKNSLREVINQYANLECLSQGGEVRLYFPSDTYERSQALLKELPNQIGNVRIRTMPMEKTHKDLTIKYEFIITYLKCLMLPNPPNE